MATINTNPGALIALQNLNKTNMNLQEVQQRINTGLEVSSAKDNGGIYAIAQSMRADLGGFKAVGDSIDLASSTVDVALAAGEAISDILVEMKEKALAGADASLDTASRDALNEDMKALRDQIQTITDNAEFNGTNLIDGTNITDAIQALANADGSNTLDIDGEDLTLGGANVTVAATASFATATEANTLVTTIETSLDNINQSLARLGTGSKSLSIHNEFVSKLSDAVEVGIGNLVDADLARESARLQSLQVQQQLGTQALSIANQAPNTILSYFR